MLPQGFHCEARPISRSSRAPSGVLGALFCLALEESRHSTVLRAQLPVPAVPALPQVSQERAPGAEQVLRMQREVRRNSGRRRRTEMVHMALVVRFSSLDRRGAVRAAAGLRWGLSLRCRSCIVGALRVAHASESRTFLKHVKPFVPSWQVPTVGGAPVKAAGEGRGWVDLSFVIRADVCGHSVVSATCPEHQEKDYSRKNVMLQEQRLGVLFTTDATAEALLGESVPQQGYLGWRTARAAEAQAQRSHVALSTGQVRSVLHLPTRER